MSARLRAVSIAGLALLLFLLGAEASARLDDWLHQDTPLLASPDRVRELTVQDEHGIHGRPHGHFKKWKLNAFGFRSPAAMERTPPPGVTRLLILGASETFGLHEGEGKEYPAQLTEQLQRDGIGEVEVVNAAMAGMTVHSQLAYWDQWAAQFRPHIVLVYPSPMLYLDDEPPHRWPRVSLNAEPPARTSRFADRLRDRVRRIALLRKLRLEWLLRAQAAGKSADWFYEDVPPDRLQFFLDDVEALARAVTAQGARPVLLTHAIKAGSPIRPEDVADVREFRPFASRATEPIIVAFEDAANAGLRRLAADRGMALIDVAAHLNGHREWFADLVHFNDVGAAEMARLLAAALADPQHSLLPRRPQADRAP